MKYKHGVLIVLFCVFMSLAYTIRALPNSFIAFRDTVYMQDKELLETLRLYTGVKQDIEELYTGAEFYLMLSHCEYLMGISFRAEGRSNEAAAFFEQGIVWAEESLRIDPTSEAYRLLGTNIAFLCEAKPSYGIKNFGKIEKNAQKALELDPQNVAAKCVIAIQHITAPWPFTDVKKGAAMLDEITRSNYLTLDKENLFNLYLVLEMVCIKQKKNQEAQIWHDKATELYSTNNFIAILVK